jgi:hypothetical protein
MGRGVFDSEEIETPLPPRARNARGRLPHKGGGVRSKLVIMCKSPGDREMRGFAYSRFLAGG